jgi:hypothetical protein
MWNLLRWGACGAERPEVCFPQCGKLVLLSGDRRNTLQARFEFWNFMTTAEVRSGNAGSVRQARQLEALVLAKTTFLQFTLIRNAMVISNELVLDLVVSLFDLLTYVTWLCKAWHFSDDLSDGGLLSKPPAPSHARNRRVVRSIVVLGASHREARSCLGPGKLYTSQATVARRSRGYLSLDIICASLARSYRCRHVFFTPSDPAYSKDRAPSRMQRHFTVIGC